MKHRLFLAIETPPETTTRISALQLHLDKLQLPVEWQLPEKLHLTTNFIGKADDTKETTIRRKAGEVAGNNQSFTLTPAFLETLYRKHEGSYVYLGLTGDIGPLKLLRRSLAEMLISLNVPQTERYLPHITIGQLKKMDPVMTKTVLAKIQDIDFEPLPPFPVDHLVLYESILSRNGSHYRKIGRFMLQ